MDDKINKAWDSYDHNTGLSLTTNGLNRTSRDPFETILLVVIDL